MTDYEIKDAGFRLCLKYKDGDKGPTYTFNEKTLLDFGRVLEFKINEGARGVIKNEASSWSGTGKDAVLVAAQHMLDAL